MNKHDFLIVSSIDWNEIRQMPQQLATSLVESGHRVLFIENTGVRSPNLGDVSRIGSRIRNWLISTRGFSDVQDNLTVFSPLFIPLPYSKLALLINHILLSGVIGRWMRSCRFYNPVLITFLPTPLIDSLIKDIDPILAIYYCANDMAGGSPGAAPLRSYEDIFFAKVDAVFCNSNALMEKAKNFSDKTFLFPAGVDFAKFEKARNNDEIPDDLLALKSPIVGYIGAISGVFDQELLVNAAHSLPDVRFVLIGPIYTDISKLRACSNIILMGKRTHNEVPAYIKGFDVALIPYIKNSFTDAVYSCKLNEYLSMGVPVIGADLRELRLYVDQYGDVLKIAKTSGEFIEKIRDSLVKPSPSNRSVIINAARANSWDQRFEGICQSISQLLVDKSSKEESWQIRLTKRYNRFHTKLIKTLLILASCYLILFYTPLVWFAGDQLVVRHKPAAADAIVIFSGDGESSYINQSYQRRVVDAIKYFKLGYAPLIIISSGRDQTFSEVEIIKSLLVNRGVPPQAIKILRRYPSSTFQNVIFVKEMLIQDKINSVLFITSPYHSRRALWVWRKVMPDLLIFAPIVVDTPDSRPQWTANVAQIKLICYEYLAIVYYWWMDYLSLEKIDVTYNK